MQFLEYRGMSYEQASREGLNLIRRAAVSQEWFSIVDRLAELRGIMRRHQTAPGPRPLTPIRLEYPIGRDEFGRPSKLVAIRDENGTTSWSIETSPAIMRSLLTEQLVEAGQIAERHEVVT